MSNTLSNSNTPFITGFVFIMSEMTSHELASVISSRLIPYSGKITWKMADRDEVPSIILKNAIMGCDLELLGEPMKGYNLKLRPGNNYPIQEIVSSGEKVIKMDISGILLYLLRGIHGVAVDLEGP